MLLSPLRYLSKKISMYACATRKLWTLSPSLFLLKSGSVWSVKVRWVNPGARHLEAEASFVDRLLRAADRLSCR